HQSPVPSHQSPVTSHQSPVPSPQSLVPNSAHPPSGGKAFEFVLTVGCKLVE
ncbi:hypothetical protein H6F47_20725, partial [Sphaerospermopsis sp. FACHB-1094]|nr:hypothetical protein [Sphaerospermopsis sp. FACHB-1094]